MKTQAIIYSEATESERYAMQFACFSTSIVRNGYNKLYYVFRDESVLMYVYQDGDEGSGEYIPADNPLMDLEFKKSMLAFTASRAE